MFFSSYRYRWTVSVKRRLSVPVLRYNSVPADTTADIILILFYVHMYRVVGTNNINNNMFLHLSLDMHDYRAICMAVERVSSSTSWHIVPTSMFIQVIDQYILV